MTIVPVGTFDKNPRNLPYHFKKMPIQLYYRATATFYFWRLVHTTEIAVKQNGKVLVPTECFHWTRKASLKEFFISIFKKGFYQVSYNELSEKEKEKYLKIVESEEYAKSVTKSMVGK